MAFIIDGNNVMGQTPGWHRDKPAARRRLLDQLARFIRAKKTRVAVVFDGAPDPGLPDGSSFRGVKVFYAHKGSDADTRIERLVESSPDKRGLTVVTSDRRLAHTVRARGANVLRSGEFRKLIEQTIDSAPVPEDGERYEIEDVDKWLRYFGVESRDKDSDE
jgi:predicted RNA-binding protein with PIN domain